MKEVILEILNNNHLTDSEKIVQITKEISNNTDNNNGNFVPPTVEEVSEYCKQRKNNIDPVSFVAYYDSINWHVGKAKMKKWKSAVITWERRNPRRNLNKEKQADEEMSAWTEVDQIRFEKRAGLK